MLSVLAVCISLGAGLDANLGAARAQTAEAAAQTSIPPKDQSWVSLGKGAAKSFNARRVAAHYLSYAVMAGLAYERFDAANNDERNSRLKKDIWPKLLAEIDKRKFTLGGRHWRLAGWREGVGVHFWMQRSKHGRCGEAVIAFRGTEWTFGSVLSNFPIVHIFWSGHYYYQVRANIDDWVEELRKTRCVVPGTKFVTVGHSLGGGLAQHAAYQNSRIGKVYTFNTSPVTAWGQVSRELRDENVKGLEIDHVIVKGEAIAGIRAISNWWSGGPQPCDPQERTIQFDDLPGNSRARSQIWPPDSWERHRIWPLARQLHVWSGGGKAGSRRLAALPAATLKDKIAHKCIIESRKKYQERVATEREGRLPPSAITVRPTPANRRGR